MSSSSTKLVVVCFTLALLVASYGVAALCEEKVGIPCNSNDDNDTCRTKCLSDYDGRYTGGRCSTENAVNSCVCSKYCGAPGAEPALEKEKSRARATVKPGRRGMGVLS